MVATALWIVLTIAAVAALAAVMFFHFKDRLPSAHPVRKFITRLSNLQARDLGSLIKEKLVPTNVQPANQTPAAEDPSAAEDQPIDQPSAAPMPKTLYEPVTQGRSDLQVPLPATATSVQNVAWTEASGYGRRTVGNQLLQNQLPPQSLITGHNQLNRPSDQHVSVPATKMIERFDVQGQSNATDAPRPPQSQKSKPVFMDDGNIQDVKFKRRTRLLHIHVNQTNYNSTTGKLTVPVQEKNVESFELFTASIPKSEYVISSHNDTLAVTYSGTTYTVDTIAHGIYTAMTLATELGTRISAAFAGTMTVSYSTLTEAYTFTHDTDDFTLDFTDYPVLGTMLGFDPTSTIDSSSLAAVAPNRVDLTRGRFLEVSGINLNKYYGNTDIVANIDLTQEINPHRDLSCVRTFIQPAPLFDVVLNLKVQEADGTYSIWNNRGLAFQMTFVVRIVADCINTDALTMRT